MVIEISAQHVEETTEVDPSVVSFIENCCVCNKRSTIKSSDLYNAYSSWCVRQDTDQLSKVAFGMALRNKGFKPKVGGGGTRLWSGIALIPKDQVVNIA
jgi:phage/plasmid-associated DNA primase